MGSYYSRETPETAAAWLHTRDALARLAKSVAASGAKLVLAWVPGTVQFAGKAGHEIFARTYRFADLPASAYDPELPKQRFLSLCAGLHLECIDPSEAFSSRMRAGEALFQPLDKHWNAAGSHAFAEFLAAHLFHR